MLLIIKFILLGIIQGTTEPIPVSSSGHLLIFQKLLNGFQDIDFNILAIITNFGSFLAIVIIYRKKLINLFKSFFKYLKTKQNKYYSNYKYCMLVIIGTIPAGIMGLIVTKLDLFDLLEKNVKFVGFTLLITALFLFLIKDFKGKKTDKDISFKDAIIIGIFQIFALIPGISRSGSTIVGGMFRDLKRETAFDFSFILYIPITLATMIIGIKDLMESSLTNAQILLYFIGALVAFIFTYIATKWFRNIVKEGKLIYFVYYCLIIGVLVLIFL